MKEIHDGNYIFATGRSNRNYNFLVDVVRNSHYNLVIASNSCISHKNSKNVTVYDNCHREDMLDLMAGCHIIAIPLANLNISSGQIVALQAMSLGKPIIATKSNGLQDYLIDNVSGISVENTKCAWLQAIDKLYEDADLYNHIAYSSKMCFAQRFTEEVMFCRIAHIIKDE